MKAKEKKVDENIYRGAIQQASCAFACHEAVFDESGNMTDYVFLDVNRAFEEFTGLEMDKVIGRRFVQDIARDREHAMKWVGIFGKVLSNQETSEFEEYSTEFRRHYHVKAYPVSKNQFVTLFHDMTFEKKIQETTEYFRENMGSYIDYEEITRLACDLSGAEYAALNILSREDNKTVTVSIHGIAESMKERLAEMNLDFVGRKWENSSQRQALFNDSEITHFDSMHELAGDAVEKQLMDQIEETFDTGSAAVARIGKTEKHIGDFILLFRKGEKLKNHDLFMLYLSQLGQFIEKTRLEKSLRSSQRRFYTLAEYAPIGFVSCNLSGEVTYANRKLLEIMDSPSYGETRKINLLELPGLVKTGFSENLRTCMDRGMQMSFDVSYESIWGRHSWLSVHITPSREGDLVTGANILINDITDKKKTEDELRERAVRDSLTRAYNRYALDTVLADRLSEAGEKELISCIAVLDIDDFKDINDTRGQKAGDSVLKYLATRIKKELRENDLIIRTGGDEFVIYLHDIKDEKNAGIFMDRIFRKITGEYTIEDTLDDEKYTLEIGCSMGAAFYPVDGDTAERLMAKADEALYKVKKSGKCGYKLADK